MNGLRTTWTAWAICPTNKSWNVIIGARSARADMRPRSLPWWLRLVRSRSCGAISISIWRLRGSRRYEDSFFYSLWWSMMLIDGLLDGWVILPMLVEHFAYVDFSSIYCLVIPFFLFYFRSLPSWIIDERTPCTWPVNKAVRPWTHN